MDEDSNATVLMEDDEALKTFSLKAMKPESRRYFWMEVGKGLQELFRTLSSDLSISMHQKIQWRVALRKRLEIDS
jgi:hypothetical protein